MASPQAMVLAFQWGSAEFCGRKQSPWVHWPGADKPGEGQVPWSCGHLSRPAPLQVFQGSLSRGQAGFSEPSQGAPGRTFGSHRPPFLCSVPCLTPVSQCDRGPDEMSAAKIQGRQPSLRRPSDPADRTAPGGPSSPKAADLPGRGDVQLREDSGSSLLFWFHQRKLAGFPMSSQEL